MTQRSFAANAVKTGRPFGCRPKPKPESLPEFISAALADPLNPPPPPPPKPRTPGRPAGIWEGKTAEERTAHAKYLASLRQGKNMARTKRRTGTPDGWNHEAVAVARAAARLKAAELVEKMKAQGLIDPSDTDGIEATIEALTVVWSPGGRTRRVQQAKRLLRFYCPDQASLI